MTKQRIPLITTMIKNSSEFRTGWRRIESGSGLVTAMPGGSCACPGPHFAKHQARLGRALICPGHGCCKELARSWNQVPDRASYVVCGAAAEYARARSQEAVSATEAAWPICPGGVLKNW